MRYLIAGLAACVFALCAAPSASAWVTFTNVNGYETQAEFVDPDVVGYPYVDEWPVLRQVKRLIDDVPRWQNETIVAAIHSINSPLIRDALVRARNEGVNVYVTHSGTDSGSTMAQSLRSGLGSGSHKWCTYGTVNNACLSTVGGARMHSKFMAFTRTVNQRTGQMANRVVWFGTANFTSGTGAEAFNDAMTVYDDWDLFTKFVDHLWISYWQGINRMADVHRPAFGYLRSTGSGIEINVSPDQEGDLVVDQLNRITAGPGCEIRVMQNQFGRQGVASKLASLAWGGCTVWVLVKDVDCMVVHYLRQAPRMNIRQRQNMHAKTFIIKAPMNGVGNYAVITGSHNLNERALTYNDEILVTVPGNPTLHQGYIDYMYRAWVGRTSTDTISCGPLGPG
ncbi:MAG: hypothetical protein AVDCRST_MAG85-2316 [uncultured Solirubrobacteraceae bacterium]|uniref:Phospholipase D-like domain-containing protein n=1 Tax=uncultured Solirubrobacteraceae bacterium TaxID=1162706 RepID=A0A6J4T0R1_9ACTN|nr:MAG: hypothetical protein AVDCRST_MAG85-2316 [uncultured Solirubrobacteraceae bacterium]